MLICKVTLVSALIIILVLALIQYTGLSLVLIFAAYAPII